MLRYRFPPAKYYVSARSQSCFSDCGSGGVIRNSNSQLCEIFFKKAAETINQVPATGAETCRAASTAALRTINPKPFD